MFDVSRFIVNFSKIGGVRLFLTFDRRVEVVLMFQIAGNFRRTTGFEIVRQFTAFLIDAQRYDVEMLPVNVFMLEDDIRLVAVTHRFHVLLRDVPEQFVGQPVFRRGIQRGDVARNDPKQDDAEPTIHNKTVDSKAEPPAPAAGTIPADSGTTPDRSGFQRKKILLPDFEQTFFRPVKCSDERAAIYVSLDTKHKISKIIHLLGNERTRLTALVDNMLQFMIGIYSDELNYLHEKKNNRRPF